MHISTLILAFTAAIGLTTGSPVLQQRNSDQCYWASPRKEWRMLTNQEKLNYINAVKCIQNKPSSMKSKFPYSTSRYEDFIMLHKSETPRIHFVGHFLPWHRAFLANFEKVLQTECNYSGMIPYWDQSRDTANFLNAPVFHTTYGFGGNGAEEGGDPNIPGSTGGGCITSGPFKNLRIHIAHAGVDAPNIDRCLKRAIAPPLAQAWQTAKKESQVLASPNYETLAVVLEGDVIFPDVMVKLGMHNSGHSTVGGDMFDMYISPGDPLFYLHHANIDRIWASWQDLSSSNLYAIGNPIAPRQNSMLSWPNPPAGNVTPKFELYSLKVPGTTTQAVVGNVLNTRGRGVGVPGAPGVKGVLCYQYV
ncbi:Di-copper centre-containing protein [Ascodesmis nigricans]|uniref:Di-copper centre-containing protein n=1 Tax=Ascodesmis nigricans TaxID=341454 RepID=A0A4S2MK96_9PEZI|nr:Di-copper centre-containing protein [Ascodesmis nigricans]